MIDYLTDKYFRVEKRIKKLFLWFSLVHSRHTAHQDRKRIIRKKGKSVVTREVKKNTAARVSRIWRNSIKYDFMISTLSPRLPSRAHAHRYERIRRL